MHRGAGRGIHTQLLEAVADAVLCSCKDLTGLIDPLIDAVPPVVPTEVFRLNDTRHYYSRGVCRRLHHRMRQAGEPDAFKNSL